MATIPVNPIARQPGPYPAGRVCSDCSTRLSTYNGTSRCWVHSGWDDIELDAEGFSLLYRAGYLDLVEARDSE